MGAGRLLLWGDLLGAVNLSVMSSLISLGLSQGASPLNLLEGEADIKSLVGEIFLSVVPAIAILSQPFGPIPPILGLPKPSIWLIVLVTLLCWGMLQRIQGSCLVPLGLSVGILGMVIKANLLPVLGDPLGVEVFSAIPIWSLLNTEAKFGYLMCFTGTLSMIGACLSCKDKITPLEGLCFWAIGITVSNIFTGDFGAQWAYLIGTPLGNYWFFAARSLLFTVAPSVILSGFSWNVLGLVGAALCSMGSLVMILS